MSLLTFSRSRPVPAAGFLLALALLASGCEEPIEKLWAYRSESASQSSPAIAGSMIVFGTQTGELHAVSRDGSFIWKFQTRKEIVSAPAVTDDLILFGSTNYNFYAVDFSGREVWKYLTDDRIKGDPLAVGSDVIFGSYDTHLYRMTARTRAMKWSFPDNLFAKDDGGGGGGLVGDGDGEAPEDEKEKAAGTEEKQDEPKDEPAVDTSQWPKRGFSYAQPTLTSNGLVVSGNLDGHVYALDVETGELKWRFATDGVAQNLGVTSTVVERDGTLYFGGNDGHVYAIDLNSQAVKWKFKTGNEVNSSPAFDEAGTLFIGGLDKKLYAIDSKTGAKKWEFFCEGAIKSQPIVYKNLVIFGASEGDGHVYAVDTATGQEFWKHKTGGAIDGDPLLDGDRFYIPSNDNRLYAFKINKTTK